MLKVYLQRYLGKKVDTVNRNVSFDVQAQLSVTETRIKGYSTSRIRLVFFLLQRYCYFMQQSCCNSVLFPVNSFGNLLLYDFEFINDGKGEKNNKKRGICLSLSSKKMESINFKKDFQPKGEGKLTLGKLSTGFWSLFGGFLTKIQFVLFSKLVDTVNRNNSFDVQA